MTHQSRPVWATRANLAELTGAADKTATKLAALAAARDLSELRLGYERLGCTCRGGPAPGRPFRPRHRDASISRACTDP